MEKIASSRLFRRKKGSKTKREQNAKEAVIVRKKDMPTASEKTSSGGKTVVRRIKAK